jgi:hypothetical protein
MNRKEREKIAPSAKLFDTPLSPRSVLLLFAFF